MNASPKNLLIGFLALTTVAASALAWQQYRQLRALQATATLASSERAEWQKRVWDAEKRATAPTTVAADAATTTRETPTAGETRASGGPRGGGGRGVQMAALLNNPQFVQAMALQQKAALDGRYADLFRRLKLSPDQINRLKDLLVERQSVAMDVMAAAREQGVDGRDSRDQLRALMQESEAAVNSEIQALLGADAYATYQTYEQTQPQRNVVSQLETRLSYSSAPLSDAQSEQLVRILAATSPATNQGGGAALNLVAAAGRGGANLAQVAGVAVGGTATVTDATIAQAQSVLAPAQVEALKQIQTEQQAQRQMGEAMRNAGRGGP
ncbi:MAG TPA: hypothetical protein VGD88_14065 [Opitutaceae bacterium]